MKRICKKCKKRPVEARGRNGKTHTVCWKCRRPNNLYGVSRVYAKYKKTYCEYCGFISIHRCQLDVDHIDGNHKNNDESNLQTLCANCHRLKTQIQKHKNVSL